MKSFLKVLAAAVLTIGSVGTALAGPLSGCTLNTVNPGITCDLYEENADGLPSEIGWLVSTLIPVGSGTIVILEPGGDVTDTSTWSDMLIFGTDVNDTLVMTVQLVSDGCNTPNEHDLSCFLTNSNPGFAVFEDANGLAIFTAGDNVYRVHSDGDAPEPATLALLGLGLAGLAAARRRKLS